MAFVCRDSIGLARRPIHANNSTVKNVAVFCGSSSGRDPAYGEAAEAMGRELAARGLTVVYGGGNVGMMGRLADAALVTGGDVIGVIPTALHDLELAHHGLTELRVVETMHERKALIVEISDAFVALPGGIGTIEELTEVWTLAQLGYHAKPCAILDVCGYYDRLMGLFEHAVAEGFMQDEHRAMTIVESHAGQLVDALGAYEHNRVPKWVDRPASS